MPIAGMRPHIYAGNMRYDIYRDMNRVMDRENKYYYPQSTKRTTNRKKVNSCKRKRKCNKSEKRRKSKRRY